MRRKLLSCSKLTACAHPYRKIVELTRAHLLHCGGTPFLSQLFGFEYSSGQGFSGFSATSDVRLSPSCCSSCGCVPSSRMVQVDGAQWTTAAAAAAASDADGHACWRILRRHFPIPIAYPGPQPLLHVVSPFFVTKHTVPHVPHIRRRVPCSKRRATQHLR